MAAANGMNDSRMKRSHNKPVKYAPEAPDSLNAAFAADCRLAKRDVP